MKRTKAENDKNTIKRMKSKGLHLYSLFYNHSQGSEGIFSEISTLQEKTKELENKISFLIKEQYFLETAKDSIGVFSNSYKNNLDSQCCHGNNNEIVATSLGDIGGNVNESAFKGVNMENNLLIDERQENISKFLHEENIITKNKDNQHNGEALLKARGENQVVDKNTQEEVTEVVTKLYDGVKMANKYIEEHQETTTENRISVTINQGFDSYNEKIEVDRLKLISKEINKSFNENSDFKEVQETKTVKILSEGTSTLQNTYNITFYSKDSTKSDERNAFSIHSDSFTANKVINENDNKKECINTLDYNIAHGLECKTTKGYKNDIEIIQSELIKPFECIGTINHESTMIMNHIHASSVSLNSREEETNCVSDKQEVNLFTESASFPEQKTASSNAKYTVTNKVTCDLIENTGTKNTIVNGFKQELEEYINSIFESTKNRFNCGLQLSTNEQINDINYRPLESNIISPNDNSKPIPQNKDFGTQEKFEAFKDKTVPEQGSDQSNFPVSCADLDITNGYKNISTTQEANTDQSNFIMSCADSDITNGLKHTVSTQEANLNQSNFSVSCADSDITNGHKNTLITQEVNFNQSNFPMSYDGPDITNCHENMLATQEANTEQSNFPVFCDDPDITNGYKNISMTQEANTNQSNTYGTNTDFDDKDLFSTQELNTLRKTMNTDDILDSENNQLIQEECNDQRLSKDHVTITEKNIQNSFLITPVTQNLSMDSFTVNERSTNSMCENIIKEQINMVEQNQNKKESIYEEVDLTEELIRVLKAYNQKIVKLQLVLKRMDKEQKEVIVQKKTESKERSNNIPLKNTESNKEESLKRIDSKLKEIKSLEDKNYNLVIKNNNIRESYIKEFNSLVNDSSRKKEEGRKTIKLYETRLHESRNLIISILEDQKQIKINGIIERYPKQLNMILSFLKDDKENKDFLEIIFKFKKIYNDVIEKVKNLKNENLEFKFFCDFEINVQKSLEREIFKKTENLKKDYFEIGKNLEENKKKNRNLKDKIILIKENILKKENNLKYNNIKKENIINDIKTTKTLLNCSQCKNNVKNTILLSCSHTFCNACIERQIITKNKICKICNIKFSKADIHRLYL